jgi:hypothetical protein
LPETSDGISFVTDHSFLAERIQDRLRGTSSWLSAGEIDRDLGLNQSRDVNQVLYLLQRRGLVREEHGEVSRWQLSTTDLDWV